VGARQERHHEDEYKAFYKHVGHDYEDPLAWTHVKVEGRQDYTALLYVPAHAPFDLWDRDAKTGVKLYVKRVFIMEDARKLMPAYLRFIRGVIDAADLPLNVSREILQETRDMEMIRNGCVRKTLDLLDDIAENRKDDLRQGLGTLRQGAQGRRRRGSRQQGTHRQAAALPHHPDRRGKRSPWPTTSAA
jgi:HSP90 family molecular chaperone